MSRNIGGRPIKGAAEKLKYRIVVKLCTADYYSFKARAAEAGMTPAELARKALLGIQITPRMSTEQNQFIRALSGMANNLNQIARKANAAGYRDARNEYLYLADKVDKLLNQLEK